MTDETTNALQLARKDVRAACDLVCERAVAQMQEFGAPIDLVLGRMLNAAAEQIALMHGSPKAAEIMREMADSVVAGLFFAKTGETHLDDGKRH